ncbi:formate dehydrogenase accessory sulfurtransferase FdhD [Allopusillimonas ginsengisoli]|uniref:formate dehydrogenase accessory sulfurtransferase FdhD n=1 Tax=Allopusillimonas ginsengisoli TaxID=453575 RepID=UPI00102032F3|nr:formate dehydrogenase accessory sulfurtransferase FdhD [Allopusillimonas ginsengisoli]TEA77500.1 formate dehydrogenase accessory sulfurtransferase FdhD [Allopusillimonas ginsengisoli]
MSVAQLTNPEAWLHVNGTRQRDVGASLTIHTGEAHPPGTLAHRGNSDGQGAGQRIHTVLRSGVKRHGHYESDKVAQEVAIALEFNGISHATLLATPADLEDFAYGFSYTEGIIQSPRDIYDVDIVERRNGMVLQVRLASARLRALKLRRRSLAGRTGCGLCGIESLDEVQRELQPLQAQPDRYATRALAEAVQQLRGLQPLHQATGATHAAGWADVNGRVQCVREDVGRHNALDKLIGHLLRNDVPVETGFAAISSRASFEMVQKCAAAGIAALIAVSAPTTYAVNLAEQLNLMLAGFARGDTFNVYSHAEYLRIDQENP